MNKHSKFLAVFCVVGVVLAGRGFGQTTVAFDSAQEYYNNFNEILDAGLTTGNGNDYLDYASPGVVQLKPDSGQISYGTAGAALYNPTASTTTTGPAFLTQTVSLDAVYIVPQTSTQTIGILARQQTDGHAIFASFSPRFGGTTRVSIGYGIFNAVAPTVDGSLFSGSVNFFPTHMALIEAQPNGVPIFDLTLSDGSGDSFDTGFHGLPQNTVYNTAGQVGFRMTTEFTANMPAVDNFSITSAVPEPGTLSLIGLAASGLAGWQYRRRAGKLPVV